MTKIINFLKYNNAAVLMLLALMLVAGSVLAAPAGREALGRQTEEIKGIDNTLLISTNLNEYAIRYKIEKIEEDDDFYYITYTHNNIALEKDVWSEGTAEKTRKIRKKGIVGKDIGLYMAEQLNQEREALRLDLINEQRKALKEGPQKRIKVVSYSGLIGKMLDKVGETFEGYEPVKRTELNSPKILVKEEILNGEADDKIEEVYRDYVGTHSQIDQIATSSENSIVANTTDGSAANNSDIADSAASSTTSESAASTTEQ